MEGGTKFQSADAPDGTNEGCEAVVWEKAIMFDGW